jgi:hypothetical protein
MNGRPALEVTMKTTETTSPTGLELGPATPDTLNTRLLLAPT